MSDVKQRLSARLRGSIDAAPLVVDAIEALEDRVEKLEQDVQFHRSAEVLNRELYDLARAEAEANRKDADTRMREFCGWLSGYLPELHSVEVPRIAEALEAFYAAREGEK
ncbi:MAG: hypothetical protein AB7P78_20015 [Candidatus Binatia bacterium]